MFGCRLLAHRDQTDDTHPLVLQLRENLERIRETKGSDEAPPLAQTAALLGRPRGAAALTRRREHAHGTMHWTRKRLDGMETEKTKGQRRGFGAGVVYTHSRGSDSWTNGWGDGGLPTQQFSGR
ncbi:hypothetical protein TARUN_6455 [Trichoderma arundinaceum]|uniref:Uncharacterized protein n=1 Tax=Trichoderma arundinaceum TaxID=490622 RepID=A0A395NJ03_TRIAR|nr:hypothetical protein TARUN_6455 [Trichoderma arundinaceum]